jgi:hypothetical protein
MKAHVINAVFVITEFLIFGTIMPDVEQIVKNSDEPSYNVERNALVWC